MRRLALCSVALALLGPLSSTLAADKAKPPTDRQFVKRLAEIHDAEMALGMLAKSQGGTAAVKSYGQRMVDDHSRGQRQLMDVAKKLDIKVVVPQDREHRAMAKELTPLKGAAFDRAYLKLMTTDHQQALALLEAEARNGQDAALKTLAARLVPVVREHLREAQKLAGGPAGGGER